MNLAIQALRKGQQAKISFGPGAEQTQIEPPIRPDRELYYFLLRSDEHPEILPMAHRWLERHLDQASGFELPAPLKLVPSEVCKGQLSEELGLAERMAQARALEAARQQPIHEALGRIPKDKLEELLTHNAPTWLVDGCWLQYACNAATSHTEFGSLALRLFLHESGEFNPVESHARSYRDLLRSSGVRLPPTDSWGFAQHPKIEHWAYRLPVLQLALAHFPRTKNLELLGLNLQAYGGPPCPVQASLKERLREAGASLQALLQHEEPTGDCGSEGPLDLACRAAIDVLDQAFRSGGDELRDATWAKLMTGFGLAWEWRTHFLERLSGLSKQGPLSPREAMLALIRAKAPIGHGYHKEKRLEGRRIDDWLNPEILDEGAFLDALGRSHHVVPGDADGSPLVSKLMEFGGPMFRVFTPHEMDTVRDWILGLATEAEPEIEPAAAAEPAAKYQYVDPHEVNRVGRARRRGVFTRDEERHARKAYGSMLDRELYHYLLNIELYPDLLPLACRYAQKYFRAGLRSYKRRGHFQNYSHEYLDCLMEKQHRSQVDSYEPLQGAPWMSREQYIWILVQSAPVTFIDGAWIQRSMPAHRSGTELSAKLMEVFSGEVGDGDPYINHPNVYRRLLKELGISLPSFDTLAFCHSEQFTNAAFIPANLWLSMSLFPRRFAAETIGMNLAIELEGIGGEFMKQIDIMRYHGIDPIFTELHNSIDNISSGHAILAIDAVKLYLDQVQDFGGQPMVREQWSRLMAGYNSWAIATRPLTLRMNTKFAGSILRASLSRLRQKVRKPNPQIA